MKKNLEERQRGGGGGGVGEGEDNETVKSKDGWKMYRRKSDEKIISVRFKR